MLGSSASPATNASALMAVGHFSGFILCALVTCVFLLPRGAGTRALANGQQSVPQEGTRTAESVRVDRPPRLDGTLNDPLWQSAKPISDFRQREPRKGELPTERTEVRVLYTRHAVTF